MNNRSRNFRILHSRISSLPLHPLTVRNQTIGFIKVYTTARLPSSALHTATATSITSVTLSTDITLPRIWKCLALVTGKLIYGVHGVCGLLIALSDFGCKMWGCDLPCVVCIVFIFQGKNRQPREREIRKQAGQLLHVSLLHART